MATLTSTGLVTRTQAEILAEIEADQIAEISPELDLSTSSPQGQVNRQFARGLALLEEALAALYLAMDPDSATGDALTRICAISGTIREPATPSRLTATLDLDAGTYAIGTLAAAPSGRPADRFVNVEEVTSLGVPLDVIMDAEETGPIAVTADDLVIASPLSGFNAIDANAAATLGQDEETDAALRARRAAEVEAAGSSSASGIIADLTREIAEIETAYTVENDTDSTVDSIPPHSIEVVVFGPETPTSADDDAVAAQILASKAAGIGTYGTTTVLVVDSQGRSHTIKFTRPAPVTVPLVLALDVDADYVGDGEAATLIATSADALRPGRDVSWSNAAAWALAVPGVLRVTAASVDGTPFGEVEIGTREIASITASDITITSTLSEP